MKVCIEGQLSCQCLCPEKARFGGKYFLFPAILGYTGYRLSGRNFDVVTPDPYY
jgi:hypothetical protein